MKDKVRVAIVSGSGYTGGELLRLLVIHPKIEISMVLLGNMQENQYLLFIQI